jgi:hypothetical protein
MGWNLEGLERQWWRFSEEADGNLGDVQHGSSE